MENIPMNQLRNMGDEEGDISKNYANSSAAMIGDYSYRRK
jgi:hypothetical protein